MTGPAIDTKAAVEAAKNVTSILPASGKAAVLDHLLSEMTPETLKALSPETRQNSSQNYRGMRLQPPLPSKPANKPSSIHTL